MKFATGMGWTHPKPEAAQVHYVVEFQSIEGFWLFDHATSEDYDLNENIQPRKGFDFLDQAVWYRDLSKRNDPHLNHRILKVETIETETVLEGV